VYWAIKFVQSLVKALNSEGTPGQVAAGMTLGACLGLTPLLSLHNVLVLGVIFFFRVSVPGATLGWLVMTPIGFVLDPLFDRVGLFLLTETETLRGVWIWLYNAPLLALGNPTNTIVVGSLVVWLAATLPLFVALRWAIGKYRDTVYARYRDARLFRALRASKLYNVYRIFRPGI
jgi:uncharacterized protein (TIGR03546 family)